MPSYLVTGGAGFIGSNIVEHLVSQGAAVRVLDNFSTGKRENIAPWLDRIDLVEGDLTDPDDVRRAVDGVDIVLHQGALPSVPVSVERPVDTNAANITGTLLLLEASRRAKVRRVVYAGSSSAYGAVKRTTNVETNTPAPRSPYAVQKLAGEHYCLAHWHCHGLETVVVRYFNVFGPRQNPKSQYAAVIPAFITRVLAGERPIIYGDGEQTRDFTSVENNVLANLIAAEHPRAVGEVFNIACGRSTSLLELLAIINELCGTSIEPVFEPERAGDVKHSRADNSKARDLIGFEPHVDLREGLRRAIAFYRCL
ncbi:SDR family oxidoreductase [Candidatus Sumerlaeota bacterium]|nr:SDR family oxidoreductase [Candidatus Sumerlaeota bacterium]